MIRDAPVQDQPNARCRNADRRGPPVLLALMFHQGGITRPASSFSSPDEEDWNTQKHAEHFRKVPGLSISVEPDAKTGDSEVRIVELVSGNPIPAHRMPAPRPTISMQMESMEGLKAALPPAAWEAPCDALVRRLTKNKSKEPVDERDICQSNLLVPHTLLTNILKQNPPKAEHAISHALVNLDNPAISVSEKDASQDDEFDSVCKSLDEVNCALATEPFRHCDSSKGSVSALEPIRLPTEGSFAVLMMARDEEWLRRLMLSGHTKECTCDNVTKEKGTGQVMKTHGNVAVWHECKSLALPDGGEGCVRRSEDMANGGMPLVQRETRMIGVTPILLDHSQLTSLDLVNFDKRTAVDGKVLLPSYSRIAKFLPVSSSLDWLACLLEPLKNVQYRLLVLETTQDIDILWRQIKCQSAFMLLQLLAFIFVLLEMHFFGLQNLLPPT